MKSKYFFLLKLVHIAITTAFFHFGGCYYYNNFIIIGYVFALCFFNRTYNSYLLGFNRIRELVFSQFLSQVFSAIIVWIAVGLAKPLYLLASGPVLGLPILGLQILFDCAWSFVANSLYLKLNPPKRTIFIYRSEADKVRFGSIAGKPVGKIYKIEKELQYRGLGFQEIKHELIGFEAVFVAGVSSRCRNGILKYCVEQNIQGFFLPHVGDVLMRSVMHIQSFTSPVMFFSKKEIKPEYLFMKRCLDFFASLTVLVIFSPLMAVLAVLIKSYDGGPVIYKQTRLTKDGKEFEIYKFRSMCVNAESDGIARLSSDGDKRITPVGRLMRKCCFDEIPQLFNVLKGDMSFVGPRPERPELAKEYYEKIPDFKLRLQVKAGLTGYAQVYGKYDTSPYEKLEFDLLYINDMNMWTDLRLIFATFSVLGRH